MKTLRLIYFSPTGTTQKIIRRIGQNLGLKLISENNITQSNTEIDSKIDDNCLTIIGMPVYGGRIPLTTIERLQELQSNQSPVVLVVTYGNRDFDDALLELKEIATNCGFKVIAGAAFIGEHSYSSEEKPIAKNRPDKEDLVKCQEFAQLITEKLNDPNADSDIDISGNYPYKKRGKIPGEFHPTTDEEKCDLCGICAEKCPTNAITITDTVITNGDLCTFCCACVKYCPNDARIIDNPTINAIKEKLFVNCSERKEPEFFV